VHGAAFSGATFCDEFVAGQLRKPDHPANWLAGNAIFAESPPLWRAIKGRKDALSRAEARRNRLDNLHQLWSNTGMP